MEIKTLPGWKDKTLFTPGPLTTSRTVKQTMLRDMGARDGIFLRAVEDIRTGLLYAAAVDKKSFDAVLLQGCGTYGVEATLGCAVPHDGKVLICSNGAYGARMVRICKTAGIAHTTITVPENQPIQPGLVEEALGKDAAITHVAIVHLETTSGLVNPIEEIGTVVAAHQKSYIVDAMCSFGAVPIDFETSHIDWLISSANKCLEGVPGFTYVIARLRCLKESKGNARSLSFDLHDQWEYFQRVGQFRFTPPVQSMLALQQALMELEMEGGVTGRAARYKNNYDILVNGMRRIGFKEYVAPEHQGYIITTFYYPDDSNFDFDAFYNELSRRGYDIYAGKVAEGECFRIGNIGRIFEEDVYALLAGIQGTLRTMGVTSLNLYPL